MTTEAPSRLTEELLEAADGEVHVVCCEDENLALCSWDVSDKQFVVLDEEPTCTVCFELDGTDYCPKRGNMSCTWAHIHVEG